MKKVLPIPIIVIALALVLIVYSQSGEDQSAMQDSDKATNAELVVSARKETNTFILDRVVLDDPGFVAIHEVVNNKQGQVVEVSEYLEAGTHEDVRIFVGGAEVLGALDISGEFPVSVELVAVLYRDDGDKGFNPFLDSVVQGVARYVRTGDPVPEGIFSDGDSEKEGVPVAATVTYTDDGFSPQTVEIAQGETVRFVNESSRPMWVASDDHPAHNILSTFDQFGVSGFGESYEYTFDLAGTWKYHDHVNASQVGTVIVR